LEFERQGLSSDRQRVSIRSVSLPRSEDSAILDSRFALLDSHRIFSKPRSSLGRISWMLGRTRINSHTRLNYPPDCPEGLRSILGLREILPRASSLQNPKPLRPRTRKPISNLSSGRRIETVSIPERQGFLRTPRSLGTRREKFPIRARKPRLELPCQNPLVDRMRPRRILLDTEMRLERRWIGMREDTRLEVLEP